MSNAEPVTLGECFRCARPGGGCLVSMRDYGPPPPPGTVEVRPDSERAWAGRRYHLRQVWSWRGPRYDYSFEITTVDGVDDYATILKSSYLDPGGTGRRAQQTTASVRRIVGW